MRPLWEMIRDERRRGRTLKEIAADMEISPAFVQRIAKRKNLRGPKELRGGWRGGRKRVVVQECAKCKAEALRKASLRLREYWETRRSA